MIIGATPVPITMRYGRTDCPDGPFTTSNSDNLENFPNPRLGFDHVLAWCAKVFGLNDMECVALMGEVCYNKPLIYCGLFINALIPLRTDLFQEPKNLLIICMEHLTVIEL